MKNKLTPQEQVISGLVHNLLKAIETTTHEREGLKETPERFARACSEWFSGYNQDPKEILDKTFETDNYSGIVVVKDIEYYSHCEHHIAMFMGKVSIGVLPNKEGKVIGLSKFARLVEVFSRRLQIQEQMTRQIAHSLIDTGLFSGVAVIATGVHTCMCSRGIGKQNSETITSCMLGEFKDNPASRTEFFEMLKQ